MKAGRILASLLTVGLGLVSPFCPAASAGSPFYLTVERSFSNTEKPQVRLDYTVTRDPLIVRVLRPANLERFLDGQLQISRSYETPLSDLNPGYYFISGMNKAEGPLRAFRGMLDTDFRKSLSETPLHEALLETTRGDLASRPEQVIHGPPAGFSVVREITVDLEYGGETMSDLGWWFGDGGWEEDRYRIRNIVLDPLPDGVYLLQAVQGKTEAQCLIQVSSLSVQVKQSSEQLVVRVIDRGLKPVTGAAVSYRDGRGKWLALAPKTNSFGEIAFANPEGILDGRLVIRVETADKRRALVDTDFLPTTAKDNSVFVVTDRPIFKPGESFFYKGVVRAFEDGELKIPDLGQKEARVSLIRSDGAPTDLSSVVPLTGFGSFSGSFDLDEAQTPGLYRLVAEIGSKPYGGELRVRDYVKPTFYLELLDRSPTVVPGERFFVKFKARRFSGGPPRGVKYEVFLYRKKFETPQFVVEAGGGLAAVSDYHGEVRSASSLTEPRRIFSSVEQRLTELGDHYVSNTWDSAPVMEESGEAQFELTVPAAGSGGDEEWIYSLMVRAQDQSGSQAVVTENLYVTLSEAQPALQFSEPVARVGDKEKAVLIRTTYPDGKAAPRGSGVIDIGLERGGGQASKDFVKLRYKTDAQGMGRLIIPALTSRGKLTAFATLDALDGKPMKHPARSQRAVMIVGATDGEAVLDNRELELYTAGTVLSPGEKAKVFALLPANWGSGEKGIVWETIAGSKVYDTRTTEIKGRSRWFEVEARPEYGTGFYHTVTVPVSGGKYREQTLGFRIIPWAKRIQIQVKPEREETEPLKPFRIVLEVRDVQGQPAAGAELAVTVVDRAVYSVQAEMRPGVFDFFYPLPRLNLATFYSDDLQGYGYADLLKKPNFRLGALKSQSKLTKKAMRDTAGWFPHVVTDGGGRASIMVDMPANITEWLVTAIAADQNGRVGESTGKFRTVSDLSVDVMAPQFLREGEEAGVQVKTASHVEQSVSVRSRLTLEGEAAVKDGGHLAEFTLEGRSEHVRPLVLEAHGSEGAATLKVALEAQKPIHVGGVEEFEIPLQPASMKQVLQTSQSGNRLTAALPESGKIRELKVQVFSGLLGAALNAASVLVSYPYGCTEQLVHSTIPNLVLLDLVKQAGIEPNQLGPLAPALTRAQKNAATGIKKIVRNQKTDGSFGLWPADPNGSVPVSLIALHALKFARDLKVEGSEKPFNKGVEWLRRIKPEDMARAGVLDGFALAAIAEIGDYDQPWREQIEYVEHLKDRSNIAVSDLIDALKIFAAHKDKSWSRFEQHFQEGEGGGLKVELVRRLQAALDGFSSRQDVETAREWTPSEESLGFGFRVPTVVSAGMGVLDELKALPGPLETKLRQILLSTQRNGLWVSTFDSAQVIFNTRQILSREAAAAAKERADGGRRVMVHRQDGTELGELSRIPAGFIGIFPNPGGAPLFSEIQLEGLSETEHAYAAFVVDVGYDAVRSQSNGLNVERSFRRITPGGSEPLDLSKPLHKGDVVVSEVHVTRSAPGDSHSVPSRFLVIEDSIPSLAQTIDEDETVLADAGVQPREADYWSSIRETQRCPDRTVRIAKVLPGGGLRIFQVWRMAFTGRATIPPARAFDMYDESLQGNTQAQAVRVE
jgi:alpha-2-macroglobulin